MSRLNPERLHVRFSSDIIPEEPVAPRCYTLTHSDQTGELYLTIGSAYDREQISGWYTRLMRDEVLAEWRVKENKPELHVYCHVSGGFVFGTPGWRYAIFQRELPLVLETIRCGDRQLFESRPELDQAPILVHFQAVQRRYKRTETWGVLGDYRQPGDLGGSSCQSE